MLRVILFFLMMVPAMLPAQDLIILRDTVNAPGKIIEVFLADPAPVLMLDTVQWKVGEVEGQPAFVPVTKTVIRGRALADFDTETKTREVRDWRIQVRWEYVDTVRVKGPLPSRQVIGKEFYIDGQFLPQNISP